MESRSLKKVSTACSHCKRRKRKCSTTLPCGNCTASGQLCTYGNEMDGRRRESLRRARIELSFLHTLLHSLLEKLRQGKDKTLEAMIRGHCPIEDLAAYLTVAVPQSPDQNETILYLGVEKHKVQNGQGGHELSLASQTLTSDRISNPDSTGMVRRVDESGNHCSLPTAMPATGFTTNLQHYHGPETQLRSHKLLPLNFPTERRSITPLFTAFRDACRNMLLSGATESSILGPEDVNLDLMLNDPQTLDAVNLAPSTWIHGVLQRFENLDLYVRLIYVHLINRFLRWTISPTVENLNLLPECMVPTACQRLVPHHAVLDICHLPALRDVLVQQDYVGHTDDAEFLTAFQLAGVRTGWGGSWDDAVSFDHRLGYRTLTPRFIQKASRVEEWTAGSTLLKDFPQLYGKMHFAASEVISVDNRRLGDMMRG